MQITLYILFIAFVLLFFAYVYAVKRNYKYKATISDLETRLDYAYAYSVNKNDEYKETVTQLETKLDYATKEVERQEKIYQAEQSDLMAVIADNFQLLSEKESLEELLDMYIEEQFKDEPKTYVYKVK